jgi:uncharacterized protein (DUF305 family)
MQSTFEMFDSGGSRCAIPFQVMHRVIFAFGTVVAACSTQPSTQPVMQPSPAAAESAQVPDTGHAADVKFMQGMIAHHAQALVMAAMVPTHSARSDMKLLAERITQSQRTEIDMMRQWLVQHHAELPGEDAHFHMEAGHMTSMPGMLTADELAQLDSAPATRFDRLFLEYMIRHHEGALTMVARLFSTAGAAQESQVYRFASDVDADQRAEIARMQNLQRLLQ